MNLASLIVASISLLAVTVIGIRSVRTGERSASASEQSARASESSSQSSERAADATERATAASVRAALASEDTAAIASQDAKIRRTESLLEVVLEMRELFNYQVAVQKLKATPWDEAIDSPNALARLALSRRLEGRLVLFEDIFDQNSPTWRLAVDSIYGWRGPTFEESITDIKKLLRKLAAPNIDEVS
jgi:hypothetical protein